MRACRWRSFTSRWRTSPGGAADGRGRPDDRGGARARRRRRRRPVRLHRRRHRARGDDSVVGARRRASGLAAARLGDPATRARLKQRDGDRLTRVVEHRRGRRRLGRRRARRTRATRPTRSTKARPSSEIAKALGKDPGDAAWDLVVEGEGRVMAIYHMMSEPDIETALRFPWTSIGSDAGAALRPWRAGSDRPAAPARVRQLPARHRALREGARGAHARGGGPQDDVVAGDADAPRESRLDQGRPLGRRDDLRLRHAQGSRDVRAAGRCLRPGSTTCW